MILKKTVVVNRPSIIQARHLFFNWKQETRRELPPSAPLVFRKQETIEGHMTPPVFLKSLHDLKGGVPDQCC